MKNNLKWWSSTFLAALGLAALPLATHAADVTSAASSVTTSGIVRPRIVAQVAPHYPVELRRLNRAGMAMVAVTVRADGEAMNPRVLHASDPRFGQAALEAVAQWQFAPGTIDGEPVAMDVRIPVNFSPTPAGPAVASW